MLESTHISERRNVICVHALLASAELNEHTKSKLKVLTYRQEHGQNRICSIESSSLRYIEMLVDFVLQLITHLFGITQQHLCVLFVEHWVVSTSIPSAHGALHHNHCLALPHLQQVSSLSACACEPVRLCSCSTQMFCVHTMPGRSTNNSKFGYQQF